MSNKDVLKLKDVAALFKVGEKMFYSRVQTEELPAFKVRGKWRFSRNIQHKISARKTGNAPALMKGVFI